MITTAVLLLQTVLSVGQADSRQVIEEAERKLRDAPAISGRFEIETYLIPPGVYEFRVAKPGYYRIVGEELQYHHGPEARSWTYHPRFRKYSVSDEQRGAARNIPWMLGFSPFLNGGSLLKVADLKLRITTWKDHAVVAAFSERSDRTFYFDIPTKRLLGYETAGQTPVTVVYTSINHEAAMNPGDFAWAPPEDATAGGREAGPTPLQPGAVAPGFSLATPRGERVSLRTVLAANKAVLVTFWYTECGYCIREMNELREKYSDYRRKGVEILAVNDGNTGANVARFLKKAGDYPFPLLLQEKTAGGVNLTAAYGVPAFPTGYLVKPDGKISNVFIGGSLEAIDAAIEALIR